jgi:hypothetical protein
MILKIIAIAFYFEVLYMYNKCVYNSNTETHNSDIFG